QQMTERLQGVPLDGLLLTRQIFGGLEFALGLHRDPEMGLVVMAGSGGILVELVRDVAFCAPPVTLAKARDLIGRTRVAQLLTGPRGNTRYDGEAVAQALVALGRLAAAADVIESVDINPFLAMPRFGGGFALDALVVVRRR